MQYYFSKSMHGGYLTTRCVKYGFKKSKSPLLKFLLVAFFLLLFILAFIFFLKNMEIQYVYL
jgi:hypothetical protein